MRSYFDKRDIKTMFKSDRCGIEMKARGCRSENELRRFKSDRCGIEMFILMGFSVVRKQFKSDRCGIEI